MTTSVDTNVLVALWDHEERLSASAQAALDAAFQRGNLILSAPVFSELMAEPGTLPGFASTKV